MAAVTMNKMVYDIKNLIGGGIQSDDNQPSDRQVAYWINQTRALLIRQEFSKRGKIHDAWIQHFIMEFEEVNASIDPNCYPDCNDKVWKSKCKFPVTIQRGHKNGVVAVLSIDGRTSFTQTSFHRQQWHQHSKYTKSSNRWYIKGEYLYVIGHKPKTLQISALLEEPEEIKNCAKCKPEDCYTWDSPYPITMEMAAKVTDVLLKKMGIIMEAPQDVNNNATSGPKQDNK
jgi:hypothetical protein